jgi:hypothetical protein
MMTVTLCIVTLRYRLPRGRCGPRNIAMTNHTIHFSKSRTMPARRTTAESIVTALHATRTVSLILPLFDKAIGIAA